jgi:hypothetical protein
MTANDPTAPRPDARYQQLFEMACMPMLVSANWWTAALAAWCPPGVADVPHHGHHELEVPDPVERDGEHALFA